MKFLSPFVVSVLLVLQVLSPSLVFAQDAESLTLSQFRLRQAWTTQGTLRAARTTLTLTVPQDMRGEAVRVVYEFYDTRRGDWRQLKRNIRRLPDRETVRVTRNLPRTVQGPVDVWVEYQGQQLAFADDAFVVENDAAESEDQAVAPAVSEEQVLKEARRHIREQSMYYHRDLHFEALQAATDVKTMFEIVGDPNGALYRSLADIPYTNVFQKGEITTYQDYDVLRLPSFNAENNQLTEQFLEQIVANESLGAIIDLRGNSFGSVNAAVDALEPFLNTNESIVFTQKVGSGLQVEALHKAKINPYRDLYVDPHHIPVAVLVDENTSAAAEIFAAAMSEYSVGRIIGSKTSGDSAIRTLMALPDGSYLQLTSSRWRTGKFGKDLTGVGVAIDKVVADDPTTALDEVLEEARKYIYALPTKHFLQRGIQTSPSQQ